MPRHEGRPRLVQALRGYARLCNVAQCTDSSGRKLVTEMMDRIRAASGPDRVQQDAEKGGQNKVLRSNLSQTESVGLESFLTLAAFSKEGGRPGPKSL